MLFCRKSVQGIVRARKIKQDRVSSRKSRMVKVMGQAAIVWTDLPYSGSSGVQAAKNQMSRASGHSFHRLRLRKQTIALVSVTNWSLSKTPCHHPQTHKSACGIIAAKSPRQAGQGSPGHHSLATVLEYGVESTTCPLSQQTKRRALGHGHGETGSCTSFCCVSSLSYRK